MNKQTEFGAGSKRQQQQREGAAEVKFTMVWSWECITKPNQKIPINNQKNSPNQKDTRTKIWDSLRQFSRN